MSLSKLPVCTLLLVSCLVLGSPSAVQARRNRKPVFVPYLFSLFNKSGDYKFSRKKSSVVPSVSTTKFTAGPTVSQMVTSTTATPKVKVLSHNDLTNSTLSEDRVSLSNSTFLSVIFLRNSTKLNQTTMAVSTTEAMDTNRSVTFFETESTQKSEIKQENSMIPISVTETELENSTVSRSVNETELENSTVSRSVNEPDLENSTVSKSVNEPNFENSTVSKSVNEPDLENSTVSRSVNEPVFENSTTSSSENEPDFQNSMTSNSKNQTDVGYSSNTSLIYIHNKENVTSHYQNFTSTEIQQTTVKSLTETEEHKEMLTTLNDERLNFENDNDNVILDRDQNEYDSLKMDILSEKFKTTTRKKKIVTTTAVVPPRTKLTSLSTTTRTTITEADETTLTTKSDVQTSKFTKQATRGKLFTTTIAPFLELHGIRILRTKLNENDIEIQNANDEGVQGYRAGYLWRSWTRQLWRRRGK